MKKGQSQRLVELAGMPLKEIGEEFISVAEMQRSIMPDPKRQEIFDGYDIFGMTLPIAVVGGDFFHFIDLEERFGINGKMGIVIADAAGHGLPAAMLIRDFNTALLTGISFQSHYEHQTTPLLFYKINRRLYRSTQSNQFISAFYAELRSDGTLHYVNAGHYDPLLLRAGVIESLGVGGPVLGAFKEYAEGYEVGEVRLQENDIVACYTDGIAETFDGREEYGVQRLKEMISANRQKSAREIYRMVMEDVDSFAGKAAQHDDRTLLVVKRQPISTSL